jgi:hypothetical protein
VVDSGWVKQGWKDGHARTLAGGLSEAFFNDPFSGTYSLSTASQDTILEAASDLAGVRGNQGSVCMYALEQTHGDNYGHSAKLICNGEVKIVKRQEARSEGEQMEERVPLSRPSR